MQVDGLGGLARPRVLSLPSPLDKQISDDSAHFSDRAISAHPEWVGGIRDGRIGRYLVMGNLPDVTPGIGQISLCV